MKRATRLLVNVCFAAAISSTILAQDVSNPSPEPSTSDVLGPQLIAWSAVQKPQPLDQSESGSGQSEKSSPQSDRVVNLSPQGLPTSPACPDTEKKDNLQASKK